MKGRSLETTESQAQPGELHERFRTCTEAERQKEAMVVSGVLAEVATQTILEYREIMNVMQI